MAKVDPSAGGAKLKKKSATKHSAKASRKRVHPEGEALSLPEETRPPDSVSRLERTRRLLLAALRVWELKRRLRD
ncbi:MAG: hypothetical protein ACREIF_06025 [Chthoniobacterales bacterium]